MQGYFVQFLAYTLAMVGFLSICLLTYKKLCLQTHSNKNNECLCIENMLRLNPKKQIYVVRAGNERFLVASDAETTTMLAKLEDKVEQPSNAATTKTENKEVKEIISFNNFRNLAMQQAEKNELPAMKRIKEKMKA